ncbi:hypothetical protein Gotri_016883 [Gossypium trilobum]|uniref:WAT1-related protein n=1 Tax=Gossypium trilobum TaxID=34281 RepID=A0A7J9E4U5_9ROSI|nr:hypothetical protein [Gossypium trilobum]
MSHFVCVIYSNALASLILLSAAFFFTRITFMQNYVIIGVRYSSPTLASALANLIPAFTFLLGVIFRMEKLELKSSKSQIKVLGTLVSISGALVMTLYKGPPILSLPIQPHLHPSPSTMLTTSKIWLIGGLFIATASLSLLANIIGQVVVLKGYPSEITLVSFYCLFRSIQSTLVTLTLKETQTLV